MQPGYAICIASRRIAVRARSSQRQTARRAVVDVNLSRLRVDPSETMTLRRRREDGGLHYAATYLPTIRIYNKTATIMFQSF